VKNGYTSDSIWRNRDTFLRGTDEIVAFLTKKWEKENGYRLRKELFAFTDNKVSFLIVFLLVFEKEMHCLGESRRADYEKVETPS
jgi:nuclear transport factor 2 (NTF2) superfamily protein